MGDTMFERGTEAHIYATFVTTAGEAATIVGTPTISIYHYHGGLVTDVDGQDMTNLVGTTYIYKHYFAKNADEGIYVAKFFATYDTGESVVGEQTFRLVEKDFFKKAGKGGVGILKTAAKKEVWTRPEKERLIGTIQKLEKTTSRMPELEADVHKLSESHDALGKRMEKTKQDDDSRMKEIQLKLGSVKDGLDSLDTSIDSRLDEVGDEVEALCKLVLKQVPNEALTEAVEEDDD